MQDHRIGRDQLFPLETVDNKVRRRIEVELRQLLGKQVEPLYSVDSCSGSD
jgi:hypothetical protein